MRACSIFPTLLLWLAVWLNLGLAQDTASQTQSIGKFPRYHEVLSKNYFPGWEFYYEADNYIPTCGISYETPAPTYWSNSYECEPAMAAFSSSAGSDDPVQVFDTNGQAIGRQGIRNGTQSCLCFAMYYENPTVGEYDGGVTNICMLIGSQVDILTREISGYILGSLSVAVGVQQIDSQRDPSAPRSRYEIAKHNKTNILPWCRPSASNEATVITVEEGAPISMTTVDLLREIGGGFEPPRCADTMPQDCAAVPQHYLDCYFASNSTSVRKDCLCTAFQRVSCTSFCYLKAEPAAWIKYVYSVCPQLNPKSGNYSEAQGIWLDHARYEYLSDQSYLELFPWKWTVSYNASLDWRLKNLNESGITGEEYDRELAATTPNCPSRRDKLGVFVLINVITFVGSLILGRRDVMHKISCGKLGSPSGSPLWPLVALFFAILSICANLINAAIVKYTPGFGAVPIGELFLLWCSRPRVTWVGAMFIHIQKEKAIYFGTAASAILSELVLQIMGSVYLYHTVNYGRRKNLYIVKTIRQYDRGAAAHMMYAGALVWILFVGLVILQMVWSFLGMRYLIRRGFKKMMREPKDGKPMWILSAFRATNIASAFRRKDNDEINTPSEPSFYEETLRGTQMQRLFYGNTIPTEMPEQNHGPRTYEWEEVLATMGLTSSAADRIRNIILWMVLPFVGQWLFWVGFVDLAGDLYCPPKLGYLMSVWASLSIISVVLGGSV